DKTEMLLPIILDRSVEPLLLRMTGATQESLAEFVLEVQIGQGGQDQDAHVVGFRADRAHGAYHRVDILFQTAAHGKDFDIRTDLALPLSRDDQLERSPVRLRNRRKGRVNHMNANFR